MRLNDLTGQRYGRLVVVSRAKSKPGQRVVWQCRCVCGRETIVRAGDLRAGKTTSCGCLALERLAENREKHGHGGQQRGVSPEYYVWQGMKARCFDSKNPNYQKYGGRGITMASAWRNSFPAFLADMGPRPPGTTIDRIDNNGSYVPGNCRWATLHTQSRNTRRNIVVEYNGIRMTLKDAAVAAGVPYHRLLYHYRTRGKAFAVALSDSGGPVTSSSISTA